MKKLFIILSIFLIMCSFLGCTKKIENTNDKSGNNPQESSPIYEDYDFDTYDDFKEWFKVAKEEIKDDETTPLFEQFVDNVASEKMKIYAPYIEGIPMELRNREGFSNITLMVKELYSRPRIYYHNVFDGYQITIGQTHYLESDIVNVDSCSETIKSIAPNAPNIDNYQNFESYKNIYEQQYETASGNISAIVCELKNSNNVIVFLVYDDVLIDIEGDSDVLTEDFFKKLEFRPIA